MIIQLLLNSTIGLLNAITSTFGVVTALPFVDEYLVTGMGYINFLSTVFPPIGLMLQVFLWYILFKLSLKLIAMIPIIKGFLYKP